MAEKPVIFRAYQIPKIIDGSKTRFSEVIKPQPQICHWNSFSSYKLNIYPKITTEGLFFKFIHSINENGKRNQESEWIKSPYQVGDLLWVRETWAVGKGYDSLKPSLIPDVSYLRKWYKAETSLIEKHGVGKWRSPLFMPKRFARIWLEVTAVKAERLQDISESDIVAEGIVKSRGRYNIARYQFSRIGNQRGTGIEAFVEGWDSINPKHPWSNNDWVFANTFKRIEK